MTETKRRELSDSLLASFHKIGAALSQYEMPEQPINLNEVLADLGIAGAAIKGLCNEVDDLRLAHAKAMAVVEAARAVLVPMRGVHGGPLCTIKGIYEDGTDEVSARHRGNIAHEDMQRLTDALAAYSAPLTEEKA